MSCLKSSIILIAGLFLSLSTMAANFKSLTIPAFESSITSELPGYQLQSASIIPEWPYDDRNALEKLVWYGSYSKAKTLPEIPLAILNEGDKMTVQIPEMTIESGEPWYTGKKSSAFILKLELVFKHPDGSLLKMAYSTYIHQNNEAQEMRLFKSTLQELLIHEDHTLTQYPARIEKVRRVNSTDAWASWSDYLTIVEASPSRLAVQEKAMAEAEAERIARREPVQTDLFEDLFSVDQCASSLNSHGE